jgi:hypothetical protein
MAEAWIHFQGSPCVSFGGWSGSETDFSESFGFPVSYHSANARYSLMNVVDGQ